jgi:membrane AbrB-like protein
MAAPLTAGVALRRLAVTLLISAAGGGLAAWLHIPAAWLAGGALAVAVAALSGVRVHMPNPLRDITFVLTGLSMGAAVARDSLAMMIQWPVTLAALVVELVLIITLTGYVLRRFFGLDRGTAYLSSFPGHLSFVMSIAAAGVGDSRQIVVIQVTRILLLTIVVPVAALFLPVANYAAATGPPEPMKLETLALIAVACAIVGYIFTRLRVPAGYALGAMATSIVAKFAGWFEGELPPFFIEAVFVLVGALIGSRFAGITLEEFIKAIVAGVVGTALTAAITTAVALAVTPLVAMPFGQIWLGLSPGGLESMGALGIALGFDTAFIAAHHVSRLLMLTFAIPTVVMLIRRKDLP